MMLATSFPHTSSDRDEDASKKKAAQRRIEDELIVVQSDRSKINRRLEDAEIELRTLQKQYTQIGFSIKDKQTEVKKDRERAHFLDEEIRVLKKKLNT
jgi:predicted  nucleic acid-binding Zn-ribbon protein